MDINILIEEGRVTPANPNVPSSAVPKENHTNLQKDAAERKRLEEELRSVSEDELESLGIRPLWKGSRDGFASAGAGDRLANGDKAPAYINKKELPQHRVIAYLKATGMKNVEIARKLGLSQASVNYLIRQPFMELLVLDEIKKTHDPALQVILNESLDAALRLIELSKTAESEEVKRKANETILDRKWGKPNQPTSIRRESELNKLSDSELENLVLNGQKAQGN